MRGGFGVERKDSFYQNSNLNETADFDAKFQIDIKSEIDDNRGIINPKLFNNGNIAQNEQSSPTFNQQPYQKTPYIAGSQQAIGVGNQAQIEIKNKYGKNGNVPKHIKGKQSKVFKTIQNSSGNGISMDQIGQYEGPITK